MDYRGLFEDAVDTLRAEKRYRVFADLERVAGQFPRAIYRDDADNMRDITIWCSNDYLGMGQHPKVIGAMQETAAATRHVEASPAVRGSYLRPACQSSARRT